MLKMIGVAMTLAALAACSNQQAANVQSGAAKLAANIHTAVQVGCQLDGKFVPIGQDAASVIAPQVGAVNAPAGTLLMSAVQADQAMVHPAVMAVCKSLLGDQATATAVVTNAPVPEAKQN
jgi:hypothetical protein